MGLMTRGTVGLVAGCLLIVGACTSTSGEDSSRPSETLLFDSEPTTSQWWRLCNYIVDWGTATFRNDLIEQGYQRQEAESLTETSVDRCRSVYQSEDPQALFASLDDGELDVACRHIAEAGFADFYISHLHETFQDDVAAELGDLIDSECRSGRAAEDASADDPGDTETSVSSSQPERSSTSLASTSSSTPVGGEVADAAEILREVGEALEQRLSQGEIMDGVFVLPAVDQICTGIDDFLPEGTQHNVTCSRLLAERSGADVCPSVVDFGRVLQESRSRGDIAVAAEKIVAEFEGVIEEGTVSIWRSHPPGDSLELDSFETYTAPPLRASAASIAEFWNLADQLDGPRSRFIDDQHQLLAITCGVELSYDLTIVQDAVRAALPIGRGDEGRPVEDVQLLLMLEGESLYPDGADGRFGPNTEAAVESFQTRYGLPVTGVVDLTTLQELRVVETQSGVDERTENDPRCPSADEVTGAVRRFAGGVDDFDVVVVSCSGTWAMAGLVYQDFADGESVLMEYRGFEWEMLGSAFGDPAELCDHLSVPFDHRPRLSCE